MREAFAGSNVIFGVTDFWGAVRDPKAQKLAASTNRPVNEVAYEAEAHQARNIVDAANATIETLDRFVFSVLSHTKKWSQGKYTHNLHFDAKWVGVEYLKATYPALDKKTSYLQVGLYMTNWKGLDMLRPSKVTSMIPFHARLASGEAKADMAIANRRHFRAECSSRRRCASSNGGGGSGHRCVHSSILPSHCVAKARWDR